MTEAEHDLVVVGAGPGGYVAAIRAAQLGLSVGIVEKEPMLGGTCLRVGCIPSKALLESSDLYRHAKSHFAEHGLQATDVKFDLGVMMGRKSKIVEQLAAGVGSLMKKNRITVYPGMGKFLDAKRIAVEGSAPTKLTGKQIIIATGSKPAPLKGVEIDGRVIGFSTEALHYDAPPKHLVVVGAGAIGLELGSVWLRLGSKVTVLEFLPRILPEMDADIAAEAQKIFTKQGMEFHLGVRVTAVKVNNSVAEIECEGRPSVHADRVLLAVGRLPNTDGLELDAIGVRRDGRGRIEVDEHWMTSVSGVYAIGDVTPGPMLAHKAEEEGVACVEAMVAGYGHVNYATIPAVVYTTPEVAAVGLTEIQLTERGTPFRKGVFPFRANARARVVSQTDGFVKVLAHAETDRILGVHIVGPHAGDLIAECVVAMEFGATSEDLARVCHAHPSTPEVIKEAALAVDGRSISG